MDVSRVDIADPDARRVVAHVGLHKTGTTWFQKQFFPFVRNFRCVPRERIRWALLGGHAFAFDPAAARRELGLDEGGNVVLSEEAISGNPHTGGGQLGARALVHSLRLRATCPEATIMVMIRSQPAAVASTYRQYVRRGGTDALPRYVFGTLHHGMTPGFTLAHFDYELLVRHWRSLYPAERVRVYLFEEFAADNRAFARRLARDLEMDVATDGLTFTRENVGYSDAAVRLARLLNLFFRGEVANKRYLVDVRKAQAVSRRAARWVTAWSGGWKGWPLLTERDKAAIRDHYRASNAWLARELGLDLARYGYPL